MSANPGGFNGHTKIRKFSQTRINFLIFFDTKKMGGYHSTASPRNKKEFNLKKQNNVSYEQKVSSL